MKPLFGLFIALVLPLFVSLRADGQPPVCDTPAPTRAFGQALLEIEKQYLRQHAGARLNEEVTEVFVRVNVMQYSDGRGLVTKPQLDTCLASLNRFFLSAGIRFRLDGEVNFVKDDRWAYLASESDMQEMRRLFDVNHAINLYMLSNNLAGNSRAMFPSSSASSNFVFINEPYFTESLYKYILPHEFGHYFGLFHTFEPVNGQELVTRGPEGNCETAGDQICETPSDPYAWSGCLSGYDSGTGVCTRLCSGTDARGDAFVPDFDNMMSYYTLCPAEHHFTAGQYLRMKAGLQSRLLNNCINNERYLITGSATPYVSVDAVIDPSGVQGGSNSLSVCRKSALLTTFSTNGEFQPGNAFKITLLESNTGSSPTPIEIPAVPVAGKNNTLSFTIPEQLKSDNPYVFQITSTKPVTVSCQGTHFLHIVDTPTIRLSFATTQAESVTVGFGEPVPLRVVTDGEPFLKVDLRINDRISTFFESYVSAPKQVETDYQYPIRFFKSSRIQISDLKVPCNYANPSGELSVVVRPPVLKPQLPAGFSACPGQTVSVPFQSDVPAEFINGIYQLQLSDQNGQFANDSTRIIGETRTGSIPAILPTNLPAGSGYRTRLVITTSQGRVTGEPGESLTIRAKPQAILESGQQSIFVADSTRLTIAFTGDSPWSYTLSNGQSLTASQSPATIVVKPTQTTDYRVTAVQNACGVGSASGLATVTVLQPLGPNPVYSGNLTVRLWPNPTGNKVFIEWADQPGRTVDLILTNLNGQVLHRRTVTGTGLPEQQEINVSALPAGLYTVSASNGHSRQTVQFLKEL
jgi:hypothetical protein